MVLECSNGATEGLHECHYTAPRELPARTVQHPLINAGYTLLQPASVVVGVMPSGALKAFTRFSSSAAQSKWTQITWPPTQPIPDAQLLTQQYSNHKMA